MPVMLKKLLKIFRPGKHVASDGRPYEFTEADLKAAAEAYDPALHQAPLVIGHPKHDAPAYGWVKALSFSEFLEAEHDDVDPQFAEIVNKGFYKKISASFYHPDSKNNPKPGVFYLRHIGFLGAQPPAVKGLPVPAFSEDEDFVEFEESPKPWFYESLASMMRRMRDYFIDSAGMEKADELIPDYHVREMERTAANISDSYAKDHNYSESEEDAMSAEEKQRLAELEDRNKKLEADAVAFAEREKTLAEQAAARRRQDIVAFADGLVTEGRLLPKDKIGLVEFIAAQDSELELEFAEGETTVKKSGHEWLEGFLKGLPKQVDFRETTAGKGEAEFDTGNAEAISQRALEFVESESKAGRTISISAAVHHVTKQAQAD